MDKIPRIGFFQSSIGVTVGKILINLWRSLKKFFSYNFALCSIGKADRKFINNDQRLEHERKAKKDYHLHHVVRPTIDEIQNSICRMRQYSRPTELELTDSLKPCKMRKV